jgi:hypothetical protein
MIENWIDELAKVWEISDKRFGTVRSFRMMEKAEFPDSIDPVGLDVSPMALTFPGTFEPEYSEGGPHIGYWKGQTEFHVASDLDRSRVPSLLPWYGMILKAATANMTLGGSVELFLIDSTEDAITGLLPLSYGGETAHWGFVVKWTVKERLEGQLVIGQ